MNLKKLIGLSLLFFAMNFGIIGCANEETKTEGAELYGKWNWVSSISGLHGTMLTPKSEGYSMTIEFKSSGNIVFRRMDSITAEKPFSIIHDSKTSNLPIIVLDNSPLWMYSIKNDSLFLNNICSLCYNEKYIRIR